MTSTIKKQRKASRFVNVFTSRNVTSLPSWTITMSSALYFIFLFMKRNKCFWFMPEAAWTWVSTWKKDVEKVCITQKCPTLLEDILVSFTEYIYTVASWLKSWARHLNLGVPLSTLVYKWVPDTFMLEVTLPWISFLSRGKVGEERSS